MNRVHLGQSRSRANGSQNEVQHPPKEQNMSTSIPEANTLVNQDEAEKITLPPIVAPELAAFQNLSKARQVHFAEGDADPFITRPCPAWCTEDEHSVVANGREQNHRSEALGVPFKSLPGIEWPDGSATLAHFEVSLKLGARAVNDGPAWVQLKRFTGSEETKKPQRASVGHLTPREARALAEALNVAANLADPDSEFEAAGA